MLQHRACELPPALAACTRIDWPGEPGAEAPKAALRQLLLPRTDSMRRYLHSKEVQRAFNDARFALGKDFDPRSTAQGETLLALLLKPRLEDLDEEGLALAGFEAAAQALSELDDDEGYMMRLLLGEILAEAQLQNPRYALVAANYARARRNTSFLTFRTRALRGKTAPASTVHLPFTVARAASKLAEIDASRVDLSTLAALLQTLDARPGLDGPANSAASMVGRTLGKLRGAPLVDALLHALSEWAATPATSPWLRRCPAPSMSATRPSTPPTS